MPTEGAPSVPAGLLLKSCLLIAAGACTQLGKDKTQLRDWGARPCAMHTPVQPTRRSDSTPTPRPAKTDPRPPPSPGLFFASHPPALNFPGLPGRQEALGGGAPGAERAPVPGLGDTRTAGGRMLAKPAVPGAPRRTWPGVEGGKVTRRQRAPLSFLDPGHHPLDGRIHSAPLPPWEGRGNLRVGSPPPRTPLPVPSGVPAPTAPSFPRGEGAAGNSGRSPL